MTCRAAVNRMEVIRFCRCAAKLRIKVCKNHRLRIMIANADKTKCTVLTFSGITNIL